jgi:hypothetical protein
VLEALAYAPDGIEPLLAEAHPGAPWRAAFRIGEPSAQLAEAISFMGLAIRAVTSLDGASRIDALRVLCAEERSGEGARDRKVGPSSAAINPLSTPRPRSVRSEMKPSSSPATHTAAADSDSSAVKSAHKIGASAKDALVRMVGNREFSARGINIDKVGL